MERRTEQVPIMLTKTERELVERLAEELKGTNSQVFRLALSKLNQEMQKKPEEVAKRENENPA